MSTAKTLTAAFLLIISFTVFAPVIAEDSSKPDLTNQSWTQIENHAKDCVVQIFTQRADVALSLPTQQPACGSGFFITDLGELVTCAHVVDQAITVWIRIPSFDERLVEAIIVDVRPEQNIALLRIADHELDSVRKQLGNINYLQLGDSDNIKRTDKVLAFAHGQSLTSTSGAFIGREQKWLVIDSAQRPCNAGGPLFSRDGLVVAINWAGLSENLNLFYAIPINDVKTVKN